MNLAATLKLGLVSATAMFAGLPTLVHSANWNGAYFGSNIGGIKFEVRNPGISTSNRGILGGAIAGYDYDLGTWVVGAGADIDLTDVNLPGSTASPDRIWHLKVRSGYKIGDGLLYGTGGYTNAHIDTIGSDGGYFFGSGYEHQILSNFSIGGEVLYHDFNNFNNTNTDVNVISYQIRGTFRF